MWLSCRICRHVWPIFAKSQHLHHRLFSLANLRQRLLGVLQFEPGAWFEALVQGPLFWRAHSPFPSYLLWDQRLSRSFSEASLAIGCYSLNNSIVGKEWKDCWRDESKVNNGPVIPGGIFVRGYPKKRSCDWPPYFSLIYWRGSIFNTIVSTEPQECRRFQNPLRLSRHPVLRLHLNVSCQLISRAVHNSWGIIHIGNTLVLVSVLAIGIGYPWRYLLLPKRLPKGGSTEPHSLYLISEIRFTRGLRRNFESL